MGPLTNTASRLLQASDLIPTKRGCFTMDITFDLLKHPFKAKFTYIKILTLCVISAHAIKTECLNAGGLFSNKIHE